MAEWRPIPGYLEYEASDDGSIRPVKPRYKTGRGRDGLRPWIVERHGRKSAYVTLHIGGKRIKHLVHRLVCLAFHGLPSEDQTDCCHRNHNSLDNRASNLRWGTHSENIEEQWEQRIEARARIEDALEQNPGYTWIENSSDTPF